MKKHLFSLFLLASVVMVSACGGSSDTTSVDAAAKHNEELLESTGKNEKGGWFIAKAASGGMFKSELGRLAGSKANDPRVRQYGQLMLNHHTQTNAQLKQIADLKNLMVPSTMGEDQQETYTEVMSKNGASFDQAFLEAMIKDHEESLEEFEEMATEGTDTEIKAFAQKAIPLLRAHLAQAEELKDQLKP